MSFISSLFSDPPPSAKPPAPNLPPPVPTLSDANIEAADREARQRLRARTGPDAAVLSKGLGDTGTGTAGGAALQRQTLLGGAGTV